MIQNRDSFLQMLADKMGRAPRTEPLPPPAPVNDYATTNFTDLDAVGLESLFLERSAQMLAKTKTTLPQNLPGTVAEVARQYGDSIVLTADERLQETGVVDALKTTFSDVFVWDHTKGEESIAKAEAAKVGIVFADYAIADCGFAVLLSSKERARSVSLLPENNIIVIRRSTILPRVAQLAEILHQRAQARERMPSCINIIGGPSSTADIELIKVVGVHGPVTANYIAVED